LNENDVTEIMHAYLEMLCMLERAKEALSGKIIPANPDNLQRYKNTKKWQDPRPSERHARNLEALRVLGLRPSRNKFEEITDEQPENVFDRLKKLYFRFKHIPLTNNNKHLSSFFESMERMLCAQGIISSPSNIGDNRKRNVKALEVLGLCSDMAIKKRTTELKNILFFIEYLDLVGIHPPSIKPRENQDQPLTKEQALQHLSEVHGKSTQAVFQQLKRGRQAMIDRDREKADIAWLFGALPPFYE
jgi:hypothetical protein